MPESLPTRPFTALPAPPSGATGAVRGGRAIRRRRRLMGTGAVLASVALTAGVVVAAGSGSPQARHELVPAGPGVPSPPTVAAAPETSPGGVPAVAASTGPRPAVGQRPRATSSPSARPAGTPTARPAPPRGGYRTPDLVRRYQAAPRSSGGPAGRICSGSREGTGTTMNDGSGFCVTAYAHESSRGHELVLEVCRDSTGPGSMRFSGRNEAELVVHNVLDQDRVVWRWSVGHPDTDDAHTLQLETSACWTWTAPWTDVDGSGRALEDGTYEVAVTSTAQQLRGRPAERARFSVR